MAVPRARTLGIVETVPANTRICGHAKTWSEMNPPYVSRVYSDYDQFYPYVSYVGGRDYCRDELHKGPPYLEGGNLTIFHSKVTDTDLQQSRLYEARLAIANGTMCYRYNGGFLPRWPVISYPFSVAQIGTAGSSGYFSGDYGNPSSQGPTAWNKFKPKTSNADLGIFTGELREVPRMLKTTGRGFMETWRSMGGSLKSKEMYPKKIADHYLNTQFGWLPFVRDLVSFYNTYQTADRRLSQLYRDNGRWIRRRGSVSSTVSKTTLASLNTDGAYAPYVYPTIEGNLTYKGPEGWRYVCKINRELTINQSFSGAFKYWLPSYDQPDKRLNKIQNYLKLYGANINPSLVWNLTPWTWLADWVANIGDNVSNYSSMQDDNLVSKYAFIMQSTDEWLENHTKVYTLSHGPVDCRWFRGCSTKRRESASPFGFAIDTDAFSPRQWSILTALGFSRLKLTT